MYIQLGLTPHPWVSSTENDIMNSCARRREEKATKPTSARALREARGSRIWGPPHGGYLTFTEYILLVENVHKENYQLTAWDSAAARQL